MKHFFFSLKAGYIFFFLLALVFGIGSQLAEQKQIKLIFKEMTVTHISHCLEQIAANPMIMVWLIVFMVISVCLFVNTFCCTTTQIKLFLKVRKKGEDKDSRTGQMALIHVVALVVIASHIMDIVLIQRYRPTRVFAGETMQADQHRIRVKAVSYVTNRAFITGDKTKGKTGRIHIPAQAFSKKDNFAVIEIEKASGKRFSRELRILSPVRLGATFIFLNGFFTAHGDTRVGVEIHHSYNPLSFVFFTVYAVLFGLLLFRFYTTRRKGTGKEITGNDQI